MPTTRDPGTPCLGEAGAEPRAACDTWHSWVGGMWGGVGAAAVPPHLYYKEVTWDTCSWYPASSVLFPAWFTSYRRAEALKPGRSGF